MGDFRNRPNGVYTLEANWEALYILTKHWKNGFVVLQRRFKFFGSVN